ncbi:MAG TPA: ChaN family lipoprotein [Nitrospira sp.]
MSIRLHRAFAVLLFLGVAACSGSGVVSSSQVADSAITSFQADQIIDTQTGEVMALDQLIGHVRDQEVIYLGEEHHNRFHVESARTVLTRLVAEGRQPVLAMEMFGWDVQPILDRYVLTKELSRQEFLETVRWQQNWGGPFDNYEPLVQFAKEQGLPLVSLNPPKSLIRSVAKQGLAKARQGEEMAQWGMQNETIVEDSAYRTRIFQQLRACHDGGSDALYEAMYEASMVRDEGMASMIASKVTQLRTENAPHAGPVISYTGGGHIQFNLPVPKRVARRLDNHVRQMSIYMTSFEKDRIGDLQEMIKEKIADLVWLTPVSAEGPPRRCR